MKRILIVEDDLDIQAGLQLVLSDKYDVLQAFNGREALQVLGRDAVDLVLLDMLMPVLDGVGVLQEMAAKAISVPVIVLTAQKDMKDRSKAFRVSDALIKPFDLNHLEECIARVLEEQENPPSAGGGEEHKSPDDAAKKEGAVKCEGELVTRADLQHWQLVHFLARA